MKYGPVDVTHLREIDEFKNYARLYGNGYEIGLEKVALKTL